MRSGRNRGAVTAAAAAAAAAAAPPPPPPPPPTTTTTTTHIPLIPVLRRSLGALQAANTAE